MLFSDIIGQDDVKNYLTSTASQGRIPHAQLFVGPEGSGTLPMAIAYAQYVLCSNRGSENEGGVDACNLKFRNLNHPDLHFVYPSITTEDVKKKPKSLDFIAEWREMLQENPYAELFDWYRVLGIKNQQGEIRVEDAIEMLRIMSLKSFEGGYRVIIIWMADKMNVATSNKLLKMLEEPGDKTLFLLIAEKEEDLLATVRSRCQIVRFRPLSEQQIAQALEQRLERNPREALLTARRAQGNFNRALSLLQKPEDDLPFEEWFVTWVRAAFRARGNAAVIQELISWSEKIAALGRETQKRFLEFCAEMFRQALLLNYQVTPLVYYESTIEKFKLENFAPFVNDKNILEIHKEISDAIYHIERNANPKIVLADLSIKLTRLIHKK